MKGGDFFAKTRRANGMKWRADLDAPMSITCRIAVQGVLRSGKVGDYFLPRRESMKMQKAITANQPMTTKSLFLKGIVSSLAG